MNTVINNINILNIKKSKFITLIYKINNLDDVDYYLKKAKLDYKDATHYCYAYILNNIKKSSDDKEPSNTAGIVILNVLEHNNLNMTLCIVVRYFGGIKLGANGLVKAYSASTKEALLNHIKVLYEGYNIEIRFDYKYKREVDYILRESNILRKEYKDIITYITDINKEALDKLKNIKDINIIINKEIYL